MSSLGETLLRHTSELGQAFGLAEHQTQVLQQAFVQGVAAVQQLFRNHAPSPQPDTQLLPPSSVTDECGNDPADHCLADYPTVGLRYFRRWNTY